jgi:hypothetical protein
MGMGVLPGVPGVILHRIGPAGAGFVLHSGARNDPAALDGCEGRGLI